MLRRFTRHKRADKPSIQKANKCAALTLREFHGIILDRLIVLAVRIAHFGSAFNFFQSCRCTSINISKALINAVDSKNTIKRHLSHLDSLAFIIILKFNLLKMDDYYVTGIR
jgi:hypothetical protein